MTKTTLNKDQRSRAEELFNSMIENEDYNYEDLAYEVIWLRDALKDNELFMFHLDDIKMGKVYPEDKLIYLDRNGEGGYFNKDELVNLVREFISERL